MMKRLYASRVRTRAMGDLRSVSIRHIEFENTWGRDDHESAKPSSFELGQDNRRNCLGRVTNNQTKGGPGKEWEVMNSTSQGNFRALSPLSSYLHD